MRIFWILIALVVAGFAVVLALPGGSEQPSEIQPVLNEHPESPTSPAAPDPIVTEPVIEPTEAPDPSSPELKIKSVEPQTPQAETTPAPDQIDEPALPTISDPTPPADDVPEIDDVQEVSALAPAEQTTSEKPTGWASLTRVAPDRTPEPDTGFRVITNDDGSIKIGNRFVITGQGTAEQPYILPWDLLVAAHEFYSPREGKKIIPEYIKYLNGKYVALGGYLSFPLATPDPTECLVMLNQWDGCCIGVPPTPYDAIEVTLANPANRTQRFAVEGRIVGKFTVDPYLVGDWLVGLYLLEDARLDTSNARSAEEVYGSQLPQFQPSGG